MPRPPKGPPGGHFGIHIEFIRHGFTLHEFGELKLVGQVQNILLAAITDTLLLVHIVWLSS